MSAAPTAFEQALLEYTNLIRIDPAGEFDRLIADAGTGRAVQSNITNAISYFGVDVAAFRSQMAAFDPVAPLAWNASLAAAADGHSQRMIDTDTQSHRLPGEASLGARIADAGYTGYRSVGENIFAYTQDPLYGHAGFIIDWGYDAEDFDGATRRDDWRSRGDGMQDPAGHRISILSPTWQDIGISALAETDPGTQVGPYVVTQNFGALSGPNPAQLLGVVIADADGDRFYDIGEGLGGVLVTASGSAGVFSTTTWEAGGYQMELPAGDYVVQFSGGALAGTAAYRVTIGSQNVKLDGFAADAAQAYVTLTGTAGADVLLGDARANELFGLGGNDVLFGDGLEAVYFEEVSGQVYRLYQAALGRQPDHAGHLDWIERIALEGRTLAEAAGQFVASREFQQVYGVLSDAGFVDLLYQNVLGRSPDAGGRANWLDALQTQSRADVVLGFSESREFRLETASDANSFAQSNAPSVWSDDVYRLYQATLDRAPDLSGFLDWTGKLGGGQSFLTVVGGFTNSAEFQTTYGALTDTGFIELLYQNVLGRGSDAAGLADWTDRMANGASRADVVQGFAQSGEFIAATAGDVTQWVRAQGPDDRLVAGPGSDILAGGVLSDSFVFDQSSGGGNRVLDLEAWDNVDLSAFGYQTQGAARQAFSQSGTDLVFADQGVTVTFVDTGLGLLTDEMIVI